MLVSEMVKLQQTMPANWPAWIELENSLKAALASYANVHRGAGQHSLATTHLFEQARLILHRFLGLSAGDQIFFCTPYTANTLICSLAEDDFRLLSSADFGLALGICALGVRRRALKKLKPQLSGGGTVRLVSQHWAVWDGAPERFEAGTPNIVGAIALARAAQLIEKHGPFAFEKTETPALPLEEVLYQDELLHLRGKPLLDQMRRLKMDSAAPVPGERQFLNLDHAASTPTFTPVWDSFRQTLIQPEYAQKQIVAEVRRICLSFLSAGMGQYELIFAGNTTEAVNILCQGLRDAPGDGHTPVIVNTLLEHNSNELPWRSLQGYELVRLDVDVEGFLDLSELEALLWAYNTKHKHGSQRVRLLAVSGGSNVLGSCNDLAEICRIAHRYDVKVLVDAAQLTAHRSINMQADGIDFLAFSAHKAYAPFGSGGLVARKGLLSFSQGQMDQLHASGEANAAGIAALGKALLLLDRIGKDVIAEEELNLTRQALHGLANIPGIQIYGIADASSHRIHRRAGVIAFACDNAPHNRVGQELAEQAGIGVRTGCFCAHLLVKRLLNIHPLRARLADVFMLLLPGFTAPILPGLVRISFGLESNGNDVDRVLAALRHITSARRSLLDRVLGHLRNGTPFLHQSNQVQAYVERVSKRVFELSS
jgi:selenocysteine lyase/cysteine desulfurase